MKIIKVITFQSIVILSNSIAQELPDQTDFNVGQFVRGAITLKVIGDDSNPIEDVKIHIAFQNTTEYRSGENNFHGKSDDKGLFYAESNMTGVITINVEKEGYYKSSMMYQFPSDENMGIQPGEKLSPWNPTIPIILKKIIDPVPLIARPWPESRYVPTLDNEYGFDLVEYDWVKPHGKGVQADFLIQASMDAKDDKNYTATIKINFSNQNDGWIAIDDLHGAESELKYPREAPDIGYQKVPIKYRMSVNNGIDEISLAGGHPYGYFFRLRTEIDNEGNIKSAIYARVIDRDTRQINDKRRMQNPIFLQASPQIVRELNAGAILRIPYYLNPEINDRRLEFDRKNNLADDVSLEPQNILP